MKSIAKQFVLLIGGFTLFLSGCSDAFLLSPTSTPANTLTPSRTVTPSQTATPSSTPEPTSTPLPAADALYAELLERAKLSDPDFDFTELRLAFTKSTQYDPYNFDKAGLKKSMYDAFNERDYESALEFAGQILEKNYLMPDPHFIAFRSYDELGDAQNSDFHYYFLNGLINSILASGDGTSPETAFEVIQIEEEYLILGILGIRDSTQAFIEENEIPYDVFDGIDMETNDPVTIYFDISIPYHWLGDTLGK